MEIINGLLQNNALLLAQATINALKNLPENDSNLTLFKFNTCSDKMGNISLGVCTQKNGLIEYNFATALICRVVHIQYNLRIFAGGILIAVDTVSLSSGKLCINILIFQHYLIIAGTGLLFVMRECRVWAEWPLKRTWNVNQASKATRQSPMDISFQFIFFCFISFAPFPCLFSV